VHRVRYTALRSIEIFAVVTTFLLTHLPTQTNKSKATAPFFSVVIPQYNRTSFLLKLIDSISAQSFTDLEVCISDDRSPDGRQAEVTTHLRQLGLRFRFEQTPTNLRYDGNLRSAIALSSGQYLWLMGNDDALLDADVMARTARWLLEHDCPAVTVANWVEGTDGSMSRRVTRTGVVGQGPQIAIATWREYSFVSGLIFDGKRCRELAHDRWDGSEMYQMWLGAKMIAEGGRYATIDAPLVLKDIQIPYESVDSFRQKKPAPWFKERLHTLHFLARLNFDAIAPSLAEPKKRLCAKALVSTLYSTTYPFWLFEYREHQSFAFALGIALGMRPRHVCKDLPLSGLDRTWFRGYWFVITLAGLFMPISVFKAVRPRLHRWVKAMREKIR
jgi:glycosyltransferase involved in cell wall biosynthesis